MGERKRELTILCAGFASNRRTFVHPAGELHEARHDAHKRILELALNVAQLRELALDIGRRLLEFHDEVLHHRDLQSRMSGEAERRVTDLPQRGTIALVAREDDRLRRRYRPVAHVNRERIARGQIPVERIVARALGDAHAEFARRGLRVSSSRDREYLRTKPDADHRQIARNARASEIHFSGERGDVADARTAPRAAAEQHEPGCHGLRAGQRAFRGERTVVEKADAASFEMILDQPQVFGGRVLDDVDRLHRVAEASRGEGAASIADSTAARKSAGDTDSRPTPAWAKNRSTAAPASRAPTPRSADSRSKIVLGGVTKKSPVTSTSRMRSCAAPSSRTYAVTLPPAPVIVALRTPPAAPGSSISATNASVPISSSWYFAASASSCAVILPATGAIPSRSANPAMSARLTSSIDGAVPRSSFSVMTRCAAESSARFASFASATLSAATIRAGSRSTSTVPW